MMVGLRDIITCAKFQVEIFRGYDFTGGRISHFPIDFRMGLTTVQRYIALPVMTECLLIFMSYFRRPCFTCYNRRYSVQ